MVKHHHTQMNVIGAYKRELCRSCPCLLCADQIAGVGRVELSGHPDIPWYTLVHPGTLWYSLEHSSTPRILGVKLQLIQE